MDKVTKAINKWLLDYEPILEVAQVEEIHTEEYSDTVKNLALQRTGIEDSAEKPELSGTSFGIEQAVVPSGSLR